MVRQLLILVVCGLVAMPAAGGVAVNQIDIELRGEIEVADRQVRLGDVAYLRTNDLGTIQRLMALPLGEAPPAGREAVLDRGVLARWIRTRLGLAIDPQAWRGAQRTVVRTRMQVLAPARIEAEARQALEKWLAARATRFAVEPAPQRERPPLPAGMAELKVRPLPAGNHVPSRMVVWVDTWVDGAFVRTVPVSFAVEAWRDAWVAADTSPAGVRPVLEAREIRVSGQRATPVASTDIATTRAVHAGEPLTRSNAREAKAVERGEWVALRFQSGGLQLEGRAEALQEGARGQVVRVRMSGAREAIEARVVERGRVEATP
jgi:flagella basal body P-ring formation protein FlgA